MTARRGEQHIWETPTQPDGGAQLPCPTVLAPFAKAIALWVQREFLTPEGVDVRRFVGSVNELITRRGFVLWDGQILVTPLTDVVSEGVLRPEFASLGNYVLHQGLIKTGQYTKVIYERPGADGSFDVPGKREWGIRQREFFGLEDPYQMAEEPEAYTSSHLITRVLEPYLSPSERIAAIVHGQQDDYCFYCPCHSADVVYTTRHRVLCMGCGATHLVLRDPLPLCPKRLLSPEEWNQFFSQDGLYRDQEIDVSVVDFREIEEKHTIWTTDQWEEAKHTFVFFARSSPEEIEEAIRGTEQDPSVFLEAGWARVDAPPPPAHQVADDSIDVDLVENAGHSIRDGVRSFLAARKNSEKLMNAIPQLFRALELLLKAKLLSLDMRALDDHPNNPTVLKRLAAAGIQLTTAERDTVGMLRRLRNDLQHGAASFNYRTGLAASRRTIILLDRFVHAELGLWIGDIISTGDWQSLLAIPEVQCTAESVVGARVDEMRRRPEASISTCGQCGRTAFCRPHPLTGGSCLFCGHHGCET